MRRSWTLGLPGMLSVLACTPVPPPETSPVPAASRAAPATADEEVVPGGFGSLRQEDFSVEVSDAGVHVKVTPLAEEVIRLAAPDTYERLRALAQSRTEAVGRLRDGDEPVELFLVSFYSREPNVEYRPEELQVLHRGRTLRPAGIIPLTTGWGRHLLQPQQAQSAIYLFSPAFDYDLPLTVRYGLRQTDEWHRTVIQRLDDERTRVLARARQ